MKCANETQVRRHFRQISLARKLLGTCYTSEDWMIFVYHPIKFHFNLVPKCNRTRLANMSSTLHLFKMHWMQNWERGLLQYLILNQGIGCIKFEKLPRFSLWRENNSLTIRHKFSSTQKITREFKIRSWNRASLRPWNFSKTGIFHS